MTERKVVKYSKRIRKFADGEFVAFFLYYKTSSGKRREVATDIRLPIKHTKRQLDAAQQTMNDKASNLAKKLKEKRRLKRLKEEQRKRSYSWNEVRTKYDAVLSRKSKGMQLQSSQAFKHFENFANPEYISDCTSDVISDFHEHLLKRKVKRKNAKGEVEVVPIQPTTVASHLRCLKVFFRWAKDKQQIAEVPNFPRVEGGKQSRGRGITTEEFERMLAAAEVVRPNDYAQWQRLLKGMWLTGLRISEALILSWDVDSGFRLVLSGDVGFFDIRAECQKSRKDEHAPLLPEFEDWMRQTPLDERHGLVLAPCDESGKPYTRYNIQKYIAKIGKKAQVFVDRRLGKYATAHDLRKGFGSRLAPRLPSIETLAQLMRHQSTATTEEFYRDRRVKQTSEILRQVLGVGQSNESKDKKDASESENHQKTAENA